MPFQTLSTKQSEVAEFGITRLTAVSYSPQIRHSKSADICPKHNEIFYFCETLLVLLWLCLRAA